MAMLLRWIGSFLIATALALPGGAGAAGPYASSPVPPGTAALSVQGHSAGTYLNAGGAYRAFLSRDGVRTDLGTLGGSFSSGLAVNDKGWVAGISDTAGAGSRAFLYRDGAMTNLGTLGGGYSAAVAVNGAGQVAGNSTTADGRRHAFLYSEGSMRDLGTLDGQDSTAYGMNAAGDVVGESGGHAFLYTGGVMHDLGTLGGKRSIAYDINDAGDIVGAAATALTGDFGHAFLYMDGQMIDLGATGRHGEVYASAAFAINNSGSIIGSTEYDGGRRMFIVEDGVLSGLEMVDPGIIPDYPFALTDNGQILADARDVRGQPLVVLLSPVPAVPEPMTWLMVLAGTLLMWAGSCRTKGPGVAAPERPMPR
ncbi:HAF repeat-containing protein [Massilia niastensis]|uniref:HAF repeat-containing protein n=1 Tax=Massilia niastensis TaxID=544911 RepID=UPI000362A269|nr:HAF repeat-containing protein [Massilia niastensis]